ncbi:MAG TPA: ABC transporter permease [Thermotogota bacterium]|nr:ABC transporter permease [Thermotogota bacterium]HRW35110.1 ABC transporter permease [Thermotogota bacterium]
MKDTLTILRKEFANLFKDKRTVFSILFLPMIIFIAIFFFMNMMMQQEEEKLEQTVYTIYTNNSKIMEQITRDLDHSVNIITQVDNPEEALRNSTIHLAVIFDEATSFEDFLKDENKQIKMYSYSESSFSANIRTIVNANMNQLRDYYLRQELENNGMSASILDMPNLVQENVATEKEMAGGIFGSILPYMLVIYLFSSSFGIGFDTTAGEKERQTLTILLSNQVSRTSIAWAKILYIMIMNILTATISVIAFSIGFTTILTDVPGNALAAFTPATIAMLLFITLSMAVLVAAIIVVVGIFARSVKEASSYAMPIYIIVIIFGVMSLQPEAFKETSSIIFIPLINGILTLKQLFTSPELPMMNFGITMIVNLAATGVLVFLASRMFNNEKYVFRTES